MAAQFVVDRKDIENERLYIVKESFVVEKELRKKTKILAVDFGHVTINFKNGQIAISVYLVTRGPQEKTLCLKLHSTK